MSQVRSPTYDPTLFAGTAHYYTQYRPRYPEELYNLLSDRFQLDGTGRLLDLGTGIGLIAIALSSQFESIIALDPDPEMLQEAKQEAELANIHNITWVHNVAENISLDLGEFRLVTIGRAFHWMDKPKVLQLCSDRLEIGGGIAITYTYDDIWHSSEPWKIAVLGVVKKWLGEKRRIGVGVVDDLNAAYNDLPELLPKAGFSYPTIQTVEIEKVWTIESWLGYLYSTAFCRPAYLGDRIGEFELEMRSTMLDLSPSGQFIERIPVAVYIAHKTQEI